MLCILFVFFFKQKTAYEMRISDWSSDVCSSDLVRDAKLLFNVTEAYNDGYYFESDNNIRQKAFSFLNASVTWTAPDDRLSVSFWGRNILDKAVPGQVSSVPSPSGGGIQADRKSTRLNSRHY